MSQLESPKHFNTQKLLERHEVFKLKGLQLTNEDLFNWVALQDEMITEASNIKAQYLEDKQELEKDKSLRVIELKQEKDEDWKKFTEKRIEALIKQEFNDRDLEQSITINVYNLLLKKAELITEYINVVKLNNKASFSM